MEAMSKEVEALGGSATGVKAVLQQALRYAHHYGTQYVFVTDHKTGILLNIPALSAESKNQQKKVRWAVVGATDARLGLAFLFFCACEEMGSLVRAASTTTKGKGK